MESIRNGHISMHFDSIIELIDSEPSTKKNKECSNYYIKEVATRVGPTNNSYGEVFEHALLGDHDLYENYLMDKIEAINKRTHTYNDDYVQIVPVVKRRRVKKSFGDELDIHAVNQGNLDKAWSTTERIQFDQEHSLVTLFIDIGGAWNVYAPDTLWVAAACVKLVNDLEIAGKSVQIIVGMSATSATRLGQPMTLSIVVKRYNERLSLERLSAMSHIGFFRCAGFKGMLCWSGDVEWSLGYPARLNPKTYPHYLQDEIEMGHTKIIVLDKALNLAQAIDSLNSAYSQLKSIKEGL